MEDRKPALDAALAQEFVIAGHGNLARVLELLEREPMLINAAWDWGGGDWETALGGAAHMGSRHIALALLERGARMDIFAAAMLGQVEIVRAILTAFPEARHLRGPHGISLLAHAKAGGQEAAAVVELLQAKLFEEME
jgi:hypothetical protein